MWRKYFWKSLANSVSGRQIANHLVKNFMKILISCQISVIKMHIIKIYFNNETAKDLKDWKYSWGMVVRLWAKGNLSRRQLGSEGQNFKCLHSAFPLLSIFPNEIIRKVLKMGLHLLQWDVHYNAVYNSKQLETNYLSERNWINELQYIC